MAYAQLCSQYLACDEVSGAMCRRLATREAHGV
jgi:hypothetical protein